MRRLRRSLKFLHWEQGKGKSKFVQKVISSGIAVDSRFIKIADVPIRCSKLKFVQVPAFGPEQSRTSVGVRDAAARQARRTR